MLRLWTAEGRVGRALLPRRSNHMFLVSPTEKISDKEKKSTKFTGMNNIAV
jgi:hypothetical protein